jgi:hypothetical protein
MSRLRPADELHWQRDTSRAVLLNKVARDVGESDCGDVEDNDGGGETVTINNPLLTELSWTSSGREMYAPRPTTSSHGRPPSAADRGSSRRDYVPLFLSSSSVESPTRLGERQVVGSSPMWEQPTQAHERPTSRATSARRPLFGPERHAAAASFLTSAAGAPPAGTKPAHHTPVPSSYVHDLIQAVSASQPPHRPPPHRLRRLVAANP